MSSIIKINQEMFERYREYMNDLTPSQMGIYKNLLSYVDSKYEYYMNKHGFPEKSSKCYKNELLNLIYISIGLDLSGKDDSEAYKSIDSRFKWLNIAKDNGAILD